MSGSYLLLLLFLLCSVFFLSIWWLFVDVCVLAMQCSCFGQCRVVICCCCCSCYAVFFFCQCGGYLLMFVFLLCSVLVSVNVG